MRRRHHLLSVRGCLEARDLWLWERELTPRARTGVPLVLGAMVGVICVLVALIGVVALAIVPFVILVGAAAMLYRLIRSLPSVRTPWRPGVAHGAGFTQSVQRYARSVLLMRPPGVYRPQGDTELLTEALRDAGIRPGARVLEVCTGTGAVALAAALGRSPGEVTAVDISARAVWAARFNARARGLRVRVLRGDLFRPVEGETFDVVLANPPYVVAHGPAPMRHSRTRAWDAGPDGRSLLDRICAGVPTVLAPGGTMLLVHSALCGVDRTLTSLRSAGLKASVIVRRQEAFGPVMRARASLLEARGLIAPGQNHEELVVIRADRIESAG